MKDSDLSFSGMAGDGVNRSSYKCSNQSGLEMKGNYGSGPRSASSNSKAPSKGGKPATKDAYRTAPDTAKGGKINGGASVKKPSTPDAINVGK